MLFRIGVRLSFFKVIFENCAYDLVGNRIQDNTLWPDGKYSINDRIEERRLRSKNEVGAVAKYGYDKLYRLTNVTRGLKYNHGFGVHSYKFDPVGNRVKYNFDLGNHEYKYNNLNQLTTLFQNFGNGIREYSWDQNGNMSGFANYKIGEKIYKKGEKVSETLCYWDFENRLTGVDFPVVTRIRDDQQMPSMRMKYDTEGNRIVKDTLYGSSLSRRRVYVLGKEEYEIEGTNEYTNVFISGIRINRDGEVEYSHKDVLGSTVLVTDKDAKIVEKTIYDAYGSIAKQETETDNDKLFTGKELDKETGWISFKHRYLDPIVGRWLSRDPKYGVLKEPLTLNRYLYVDNNPLKYVDPDGQVKLIVEENMAYLKFNWYEKLNPGIDPNDKMFNMDLRTEEGRTWYAHWKMTLGMQEVGREVLASIVGVKIFGALLGKLKNINKIVKYSKLIKINISPAQVKRMKKITELAHNWKVRKTLSGRNLDAGHIKKIKEGIKGLAKHREALRNSLKNPNLNKATQKVIKKSIKEATSLIQKGTELLNK